MPRILPLLWRDRRLDPDHLCSSGHAREQPAEVHVLHPRDDVLPAVGCEHFGLNPCCLFSREGSLHASNKVGRVQLRRFLSLQPFRSSGCYSRNRAAVRE
jgi:hypothetical protein